MSLFLEGLVNRENFSGSKWVGLINKNGLNHEDNSLKQLTPSPNSPWVHIQEGLSEGYMRLRFGGLIFRRAYFLRGLLSEFYGI